MINFQYSMKSKLQHIVLFVLLPIVCLFIYLFYRPTDIELNKLVYSFFPQLLEVKSSLLTNIPLNDFIIYCLPGGLWVLLLTLLFKQLNYQSINLGLVPLFYGISIEFSQFFKWTDGTFDPSDLLCIIVFSLFGMYLSKFNWFEKISKSKIIVLSSLGFCILILGNN